MAETHMPQVRGTGCMTGSRFLLQRQRRSLSMKARHKCATEVKQWSLRVVVSRGVVACGVAQGSEARRRERLELEVVEERSPRSRS
ncbi:hypothetical protein U1Q18_014942 [Sarracenia purpurea var. burkii]